MDNKNLRNSYDSDNYRCKNKDNDKAGQKNSRKENNNKEDINKIVYRVNDHNYNNACAFQDKQGGDVKREMECLRLLSDGSGVGYVSGLATFVPGLLPGEFGEVEVVEAKKKYQWARLLKITKSSPERRKTPCTVFQECGGCQLQHMNYAETLLWKQRWVKDALLRIGKLDADVKPTLGMENPWRYRNKVRLHRQPSGEIGYFKGKSNSLIGFQDCLLISEHMNRWIRLVRECLEDKYPGIHTLTFRENRKGEGLILLEGFYDNIALADENPECFESLSKAGIRSVWGNRTAGGLELIWGDNKFSQTILGLDFELSPFSFLQVNPLQTDVLYSLVLAGAALTGKEAVWDLYSGIGTLTLALAQKAGKVTGIEENPFAVQDALRNAANIQAIAKVEFLKGKVESRMMILEERPDVVVVDPPRAGMHPEVVKRLLEIRPERIIYVSCDPGTLARDLGGLERGGYLVGSVQPVDMFPWTEHVETVVVLYVR